jgi:glutamate N-acetyltransferase/amino-acid N-acetyltransferase
VTAAVAQPEGVEDHAELPRGFRAGAAKAGIKASGNADLSVIVVDGSEPASVAATFTTNRVAAAPVQVSRRHLEVSSGSESYGSARAFICTSGCANAATGDAGVKDQEALAEALAAAVGCAPEETLAMSTGLIGTRLPVDRIVPQIADLVSSGLSNPPGGLIDVARAMCTTDSRPKWATARVELPDGSTALTVSGVAKGVGMIHPRMATMLSFVLTDARVAPELLAEILRPVVAASWNQISVDGDTSTNDTVFLVASGAGSDAPIERGTPEAEALLLGVAAVARSLARQQASDGEGATTLITCTVTGAIDDFEARAVARSIVSSSLLKAAVHGRDPNWGRVLSAAGNAHLPDAAVLELGGMDSAIAGARAGTPVEIDVPRMRVSICGTLVFAGQPVDFDPTAVRGQMDAAEISIEVDLGAGDGAGEAFGCDLTEAYVVENSAYST